MFTPRQFFGICSNYTQDNGVAFEDTLVYAIGGYNDKNLSLTKVEVFSL